jgi:predicted component of type VI protein secretion system
MKPMPWKFLVLTEGGAGQDGSSAEPIRIGEKGVDGWLASLKPRLQIALGKGAAAATGGELVLECTEMAALEPTSIASRLGQGDQPASGDLDVAFHHPVFQKLESTCRGLKLLLDHLPEGIEVEVLSIERGNLVERFRETVFNPTMSGRSADQPSLVLADLDFTHRAHDLAVLRGLAEMMKVLQAPLVGAVSPAFFDLRHFSHVVALPDLISCMSDAAHASWITFQASEEARWVALTMNRYLQREPYETEELGYKETVDEAQPETYLWGRGIWLVGAAVARSVGKYGHGLDVSGRGGHFDGLPVRGYPVKANEIVPLATEVPLPEEKSQEFSRAAFTPVVGRIRSNVVVLPIVVNCSRLTPGTLTIEGTLAYQLMAGRLAQFCGVLLDELPASDQAGLTVFLKEELTAFLGTLAGEKPEEVVGVEIVEEQVEGKTRTFANVRVRPAVPLEGKQLDFGFMLPLR